ncbi:MAG TPA: hypothetical protein VF183_04010 [Acidimicrobiales bacterium]
MRGRPATWAVLGFAVVAALVVSSASPAVAQPVDDDETAARELAERFAPIFHLKAQEDECDSYGEAFAPMPVEAVLDNDQIALRLVGNGDPVVKWGPSAQDLANLGQGFYLDFPGDSLQPGCLYERDHERFTDGMRPTVYAHIARQFGEPDLLALQYWTYWYYNDWNNRHESDWEFIQILFPTSSVTEALELEPTSVGYAQHEGGERASWGSAELERDGDHPIVYSSAGSHASYFGSALFMGRSASEGFGCDNTDGPSRRVVPDVVLLPDEVAEPDDPFAWLTFAGRWGERHDGPFNGPDGPYRKARWTKPIDWHDGLRSSSVVVPTGDAQASQIVGAFCGVVEWGSVQLIRLQTSTPRAVFTILLVGGAVTAVVRGTSWARVAPMPVVRRRRAGEIARASVNLYRRHPVPFAIIGLLSIPLTALAAVLTGVVSRLPLVGDVLETHHGGGGIISSVLALFVGSVATLLAIGLVFAAVAAIVDDVSTGMKPSASRAIARFIERAKPLLGALVATFVIVTVLDLTVIGLPWGMRQLGRYQLVVPSVMLEGHDARRALDRSSTLVRGRWWHTVLVTGAIYALLGLSFFVSGLLLLVTLRSLPLWLLGIVSSLVAALLAPLAGIALTLLYGDARAEHDEGVTAEAHAVV